MSHAQQSQSGSDFRHRLQSALSRADALERLDDLTQLARGPLSFLETIQLDRAVTRSLGGDTTDYPAIRLALLSSHTVEHLLPAIRVAGLRRRLRLDVHAGAYGQYRQEILDPASAVSAFQPQIVVLSLTAREVIASVPLSASADEADRLLAERIDELRMLWRRSAESWGSTVIQQSCLDVSEPLFGSYDRLVPATPSRLIARYNELLAQAATEERVLWLDIARASARDGLDAWFDTARWLQGKMEIAPQAAQRYAELVVRLLDAQCGRSRKCLVLDLDNTLWGGVVGDVGTSGIVLGEGSAQGEAHLELQRYAKQLKERGVVLAVCSKNEQAVAEAAFLEHPEMVLRRSDFAAFVANWNDKAENLRHIAEQINIGLDALVFVDDNPVERARVRESLPMVAVPELPADPALYVRCIADAGYFEAVSFTEDDRNRSTQYAANAERDALRSTVQSVDDFLRGLNMVATFGPIVPVDLARSTQLINKTNQFNTTGRRYTQDEVANIAADTAGMTLQFRLSDRFGDNGLVSVMLLRPAPGWTDVLVIESWVMSCRVFGRQLEFEAMNIAVEQATRRGKRVLEASYVPTDRNGIIRDLFPRLGFDPAPAAAGASGSLGFRLCTGEYSPAPTFIMRSSAP